MYDSQMAYFVECIRKDKTPVPGGAEGLVNVNVVEAAYRSSQTGRVVKFK
jgi:predicted dehydrogenase